MHKLETTLLVSLGGGDAEADFSRVVIEYRHIPAFRGVFERGGSQISPSEPETVEIQAVNVIVQETRFGKPVEVKYPLPDWQIEAMQDGLVATCIADWREKDESAREYAAEMRAEDLRMEG